ncbi:MAG: hypothetical protein BRD50_07510 [Bacteroidetes bacterium SW_11_45_7]|nr:MAG: hypothetical protein BRD50_07510 [Bacteroidetes bacterium SW_11_45_7]
MMKKVIIGTIGVTALIAAGFWAFQGSFCIFECPIDCKKSDSEVVDKANSNDEVNVHPKIAKYKEEAYEEDEDKKKARADFLHGIRANQKTGKIDFSDVKEARNKVEQHVTFSSSSKSAASLSWQEMGPDDIGGRCRAILIDQNNPQKMWAGGVSGGLFYSTNAGATWQEHDVNYKMMTTTVSCITQTPNGDIYFGTGEGFTNNKYGNIQMPGIPGEGIYKSTDGGQTFTHLSSTTLSVSNSNNVRWAYVNEIAADPNNSSRLFAATQNGIMVTEDGGQSWTQVNSPDIANPNARAQEVEIGPDGTVYATINQTYYRADAAATSNFKKMSGAGGFPNQGLRIEFAASPTDKDYVYSLIANNSRALKGVYKSTDGGKNWQSIAPSASQGSFNPLGNQGDYDMTIQVDPSNKKRIYVGGQLELYNYSESNSWSLAGFWSNSSPTNKQYVHADMHEIQFNPNNPDKMYVGTDGGVFYTKNAGDQYPEFVMRNQGFNVTQFYAATGTKSGRLLGGTQDNGTLEINYKGNTPQNSEEVKSGDGGDVAASAINPRISFAEYVYGSMERSTDGGQNYTSFFDACVNLGELGNALFIAPISLWEKEAPQEIGKEESGSNGSKVTSLMQDSVLIEVTTTLLWDSVTVYPKEKGSFIMMLKEKQSNKVVQRDTFEADTKPASTIHVDWSLDRGEYYIVARDIGTNGLHQDNLQSNPFPYDANKYLKIVGNSSGDSTTYNYYYNWQLNTPDISILMVGASSGVYFTDDALNVGAQPSWYKINVSGYVSALASSEDGTFYVGTGYQGFPGNTAGTIYRIDGLADANYRKIDNTCNISQQDCSLPLGCNDITRTRITDNTSFEGNQRYVTGIDVSPYNKDQIVVTLGNYGNDNYVYKADDAASVTSPAAGFESIQGDLPPMPVYDPLIEFYNNNSSTMSDIVIGTEMGVWYTKNANNLNTNNITWNTQASASNLSGIEGMPRVPTFTIREKPLRETPCKVIYAGTHGRGIFRSISIAKNNGPGDCDLSIPKPGEVGVEDDKVDESPINSFTFYPNPVVNQGTLEYKLDSDVDQATLQVIDLLGQTVKRVRLDEASGEQQVTMDFSDVSGGTYLLSVQTEEGFSHSTKVVVSK